MCSTTTHKFADGDRVRFPGVREPGAGSVVSFHRRAAWGVDLFLVEVEAVDVGFDPAQVGTERILEATQMQPVAVGARAEEARSEQIPAHDCMENAVPYVSDGPLGHGWECGVCGEFLQAG